MERRSPTDLVERVSSQRHGNVKSIYGYHVGLIENVISLGRFAYSVRRRNQLPEKLRMWRKPVIEAVRTISPSVIAFDSLSSIDESGTLFLVPGNPYEFRGEVRKVANIFIVGGDVHTMGYVNVLFPEDGLAKQAAIRCL